jgi:hypothetical protein
VNFSVNPKGDIHTAMISLDESEVAFVKKPDESLSNPDILVTYTGHYELAGTVISISLTEEGILQMKIPGQPDYTLIPSRPQEFTLKEFSDNTVKFILKSGAVNVMQSISPDGVYEYMRR